MDRRTLPEDACWLPRPWPAFEEGVADNLFWEVVPEGIARFNVGPPHDGTRRVTFSEPGRYVIRGYSAVWCLDEKVPSEALVVVVR